MVSERGLEVLRAIVEDYVETREPVGSKAIVERHAFGVSAATIRNDMALLEEEELITAPHTSSGRVPTDKGYRVFVDRLSGVRPLTPAQRNAVVAFLSESVDLDDLLARAVRSLTQLTGHVALIQYPSFDRAHVTHLELVRIGPGRVVVIIVTDTGRVSQRLASLPSVGGEPDVDALRRRAAALVTGLDVREAARAVAADAASESAAADPARRELLRVVGEELEDFRQDRLVMAGAATLARREADFRGSIFPLLQALEEQVTLLRLVGEMVADEQGLAASIGRENEPFGLSEASVLTSDYEGTGGQARVGILGPTRMDYPSNLGAARAVARFVTRMLGDDDTVR
jgi:heat-inducible transcriptional repressor